MQLEGLYGTYMAPSEVEQMIKELSPKHITGPEGNKDLDLDRLSTLRSNQGLGEEAVPLGLTSIADSMSVVKI